MTALCVFCGSHPGARGEYLLAARRFGAELANRGVTLVFGGGRVGLMGAVADGALHRGGEAIGVMPRHLVDREIAHRGLTKLHIVETMHERKALMIGLSQAFALLPGGFGSWDEFCEAVTWRQLGLHNKPLGILNVARFYDSLVDLAGHAVAEGFVERGLFDGVRIAEDPAALIDGLLAGMEHNPIE